MRLIELTIVMALAFAGTALGAAQSTKREPIIGGPCDGCEAVFEGMPAKLESKGRIAPSGEPGEAMSITASSAINNAGRSPASLFTGIKRTERESIQRRPRGMDGYAAGSGRTLRDAISSTRFALAATPTPTFRSTSTCTSSSPAAARPYIDEMVFSDDPRLTAENRKQLVTGRGGDGLVTPMRDSSGLWSVTRDIVLGQNVPGYSK
jgi:protocatechuate 3,4-dioxygenase beta subunit